MISDAELGRFTRMLSLCAVCAASTVLWGCGGGGDESVADNTAPGFVAPEHPASTSTIMSNTGIRGMATS